MIRRLSSAAKVWLGLMALTVISFAIGENALLGRLSAIAIIAVAALKARLVMVHYMELDRAPRQWRILYEGWTVVAVAIIVTAYAIGMRAA